MLFVQVAILNGTGRKKGEVNLPRSSSNGVAYACDLHGLVRKPKPQVLLLRGITGHMRMFLLHTRRQMRTANVECI